MSSAAIRRFLRPKWDDDTVVVDMRAFFADHEVTVVDVPGSSPPKRRRRRKRRSIEPPPLARALARQKAAAEQRGRVVIDELRRELEANEHARAQLTNECRELRAAAKRRARDTEDSFARSRMQGTIDHLRDQLELAEVALARAHADSAETSQVLRDLVDESMCTIERLTGKVAHLERERERAIERLEDVQMDRAGQAMQITHLEMSLTEQKKR